MIDGFRTEHKCRICFNEEKDRLNNPIVTVCKCKGENGAIHLKCLRNWIAMDKKVVKYSQF